MGNQDGDVAADEGKEDGNNDEHRNDKERRNDLRENEVGGGIDAHNFQGVNLFRYSHTADFRGDARTEVTDQQQGDDGRTQFHHHGGADGEAEGPFRNPRALDLQGRLRGDDTAHTDRHDADNQQGADPHRIHLVYQLPEKLRGFRWFGEHLLQEEEVFTDDF